MKDFLGYVGIGVLVLLAIFLLGWMVQGNDFAMFKYFAPKYEQARRETFEQSKAYNQGMIQELDSMCVDWAKGGPEQKDAIASVARHRFADYDTTQLPGYLNNCLREMRQAR